MPDETPSTTPEETTSTEPTTTSRVEEILAVILGRLSDLPQPNSRVEQLLIDLKAAIDAGGTADRELADAIDKLKARMTAVELTDTVQNVAISEKANTSNVMVALAGKANTSYVKTALAEKVNTSDLVVCTLAEYEALDPPIANLYCIIEE